MVFGAHCSTAGGIWKALERCRVISGSVAQIFVKNNMQWFGKPFAEPDVQRFSTEQKNSNISSVFGHAGYLINLGAPPSANRDQSVKSLVLEIQLATQLNLPFLVLHPGAHLGKGEKEGLRQIVSGLDEVFSSTQDSKVRIALENTAGQGTCLGYAMPHLAAIFDRVRNPERLGICLDTAHFFAAGHDIRTPKGWDAAIKEVSTLIGIEQILAVHLNDSKTDLKSRVDRHAHIGEGKIGKEAFRHIVNDSRFSRVPGCLETPKSKDLHEDVQNLKTLRSLVRTGSRTARCSSRS
jgi:deoxyribonuclease IV